MTAKRSVGTKLKIGTNFVAGLTAISAPTETAETLDTTTLDSDGGYRTFIGGFVDGGEVTISGYFEPGDAGQSAIRSAIKTGVVTPFEIIFPAELGASWSFDGVVTAHSGGSVELEGLIAFEATIKVSGEPTLTLDVSTGLSGLSLTGTGGTLSPAFANGTYFYTFDAVTASSVTVTATAANHTLKLYVDDVFLEDLTTAVASSAISLTLNVGKKLTIVAQEDGLAPVTYEVIVVKTA